MVAGASKIYGFAYGEFLTLSNNFCEELFEAQSDITISVLVILLEHVRHPLEANTCLHKQIKADGVITTPVVRAVQQPYKVVGEAIPKRYKGFAKLLI